MCLSKFEQLPDEIILEICRYLRPFDILQTFGQLNQRLDRSISQYRRTLNLHSLSLSEYQRWHSNLLPKIACDVVTVILSNWNAPGEIRLFNDSIQEYSSLAQLFPRIKQLRLIAFRNDDIAILPKLRTIEKLYIDIDALTPLLQSTEHLLDRYLFCSSWPFREIRLWNGNRGIRLQHLHHLVINPHLERLTIALSNIKDLILLFQRAPNLIQLSVQMTEFSVHPATQYLIPDLMPKYLINLHVQTIDPRALSFDDLFVLMIHMPTIQRLSLDIDTNDLDYGDGLCWTFLRARLPHLKQLYFRIRLRIGTGTFPIDCEPFLDSFERNQLPVICYADRKVLHIDTIPYEVTSSDLSTSVTTSPCARFAKTTRPISLELSALRIRTLFLCGRYESTHIQDWLHVLRRFAWIRALDLTAVNILGNGNAIPANELDQPIRLPRLATLRYIRSSRCDINIPLFSLLVADSTVTPLLQALTVMYGDLVHLCKRMPNVKFDRIRELCLFSSDTDGRIVVPDIQRLLDAFPQLRHFTLFMHSSRAINRHLHAVLMLIVSSLSDLTSLRIVCRKGCFSLLLRVDDHHNDAFLSMKSALKLDDRHQVHLSVSHKEISLWK